MIKVAAIVGVLLLLLTPPGLEAQGAHEHRIAYVSGGSLCIADADTLEHGCFTTVMPSNVGSMAWSPDGRLLAVTANVYAGPEPRFVPTLAVFAADNGPLPDGHPSPQTFGPPDRGVGDPAWSPDGAMVAVPAPPGHILGIPMSDGAEKYLAGPQPRVGHRTLAWSPDGRRLAYATIDATGHAALAYTDIAGGSAGTYTSFADTNVVDVAYISYSPDGSRLLFTVLNTEQLPGGGQGVESQIWTVNADGSGAKMLYDSNHPNGNVLEARFSPDGTQIAFDGYADASNTKNVFLMSSDGSAIQQLSFETGEARSPRWRPDGKMLLYVDAASSSIMQIDMTTRAPATRLLPGTDAEWAPASGAIPAPVMPGATATPHPPIVEGEGLDAGTPAGRRIIPPNTGTGPMRESWWPRVAAALLAATAGTGAVRLGARRRRG